MKRENFAIIFLCFVAGCSFSTSPTTMPPTLTAPPVPTATDLPPDEVSQSPQELIAAALQAGEIDLNTSLLYRAYAQFADSRLPQQYRGSGVNINDARLIGEMRAAMENASDAVRAQFRPYVVRPNHPDSIFNAAASAEVAANAAPPTITPNPCATTWVSKSNANVKVWACDDSDAAADAQTVVTMMDKLWPEMTRLMGEPLKDRPSASDDGNDDDKIDIYLVHLETVFRGGSPDALQDKEGGAAFASWVGTGKTASGYILMPRYFLNDPVEFNSILIHEFFHVLEYAHNVVDPDQDCDMRWIVESSAAWAQWNFDKANANKYLHTPRFINNFQMNKDSLHARSNWYNAYIYLYFLQQEKGEQVIADIWKAIANAADCDGVFNAIDDIADFQENFHRFAARNLNWDFGGDKPVEPLYDAQDTTFPVGSDKRPPFLEEKTIEAQRSGAGPTTINVNFHSLKSYYYRLDIAGNVKKLKFDFSAMGILQVDAVVKINGVWSLREWGIQDEVTFCRDRQGERVEEIYLIVSNPSRDKPNERTPGAMEIEALLTGCTCPDVTGANQGWMGNISFSYSLNVTQSYPASTKQWIIERTANYTLRLDKTTSETFSWWGGTVVSGNATRNDQIIRRGQYLTTTTTIFGTGTPSFVPPGSTIDQPEHALNFDLRRCEYLFHSFPLLHEVRTQEDTSAPRVSWGAVGHWNIHHIPMPTSGLNLTGSKTITVEGVCPIDCTDHFILGSSDYNIDEPGTITISWSFWPIEPTSPPVS